MPSFLSKITGSSKSKNPYQNPYHPGHAPIPPKCNPQPQSTSSPRPPLRSISPSDSSNLLAEARQVANRDPITGRPLPRPVVPQTISAKDFESSTRLSASAEKLIAKAEKSAYMNRASQIVRTTGSRYDLLSSQEKRLREEAERMVMSGHRLEFYAPERRTEKLYGQGVRD
jgi:hypothetical protein